MSKHAALAGMLASVLCVLSIARADPALLSETGSERATTGPGNNIVTHDGKTHVVWQESDATGYSSKIRTLDHASGVWSAAVTLGPGVDNHARPCIAIDSKGTLHVVIGGHNTVMRYCRSLKPNDSSAWSKLQPIADGTYPMLICGPNDTLILGARPRTHGGVSLYVRAADASRWETRELVLKRNRIYNGYAGYNLSLAWGANGALHFASDVYEGIGYTEHRGTHQSIVYMTSPDLGKTWKKADGSPLPNTVDPDAMDILARVDVGAGGPAQVPLMRNGGVAVDSKGSPFIYFIKTDNGVSRPHLSTPDKTGIWRDLPLDPAVKARWPEYQVQNARGHLTIGPDDAFHILVELSAIAPKDAPVERFENRIGLGMLSSEDGGMTFKARELVALDSVRRYSQASLERQTGHNGFDRRLPGLIFSEGLQRYPAKGEVINDKVFWLQP